MTRTTPEEDNPADSQDLTKVPGPEHYGHDYLRGGRVFSYAHQIHAALSFKPSSVLEIGVGTRMVSAALDSVGIQVTTVDVEPHLSPDIVADVCDMPINDHAHDVSICAQVLEHLPFDQFVPALSELRRVTRHGLILCLPDASVFYEVRLRLPKIRRLRWNTARQRDPGPAYRTDRWNRDGHYWEIGYRDYDLNTITGTIQHAGWSVAKTWRVPEKTYHRLFLLEPTVKHGSRSDS